MTDECYIESIRHRPLRGSVPRAPYFCYLIKEPQQEVSRGRWEQSNEGRGGSDVYSEVPCFVATARGALRLRLAQDNASSTCSFGIVMNSTSFSLESTQVRMADDTVSLPTAPCCSMRNPPHHSLPMFNVCVADSAVISGTMGTVSDFSTAVSQVLASAKGLIYAGFLNE